MGCLDHVRGHGDQVHVTGQTEEGWSWRRWGNWPLLQQQQVTACLWPVAKCRGGLGLIQLNKQNTLPIWLFIFHQHKFNQSLFYFLRRGSYSSSFLAFSGFFFFLSSPHPFPYFSPIQTRWPWNPWLLHAAMVVWEAALGTEPEGPCGCPDCQNKVKLNSTRMYPYVHIHTHHPRILQHPHHLTGQARKRHLYMLNNIWTLKQYSLVQRDVRSS